MPEVKKGQQFQSKRREVPIKAKVRETLNILRYKQRGRGVGRKTILSFSLLCKDAEAASNEGKTIQEGGERVVVRVR